MNGSGRRTARAGAVRLFRLAGLLWLAAVPALAGPAGELEAVRLFDEGRLAAARLSGPEAFEIAFREVESRYLDFLKRYPRNADGRNYLGGLYYENGRPELAARQWRLGLLANPRDPFLNNNLSEYFAHDRGQPARAIALVEKAVRLKADEPVFHYNLATYYDVFRFTARRRFGSLERVYGAMLACYRRALALDPGNYDYALVYAATLTVSPAAWKIADPVPREEKLAAWKNCLRLAPDEPTRAMVGRQLKRFEPPAP